VIAAQLAYQLRLLLRTPRAVYAGVLLPLLLLVLRESGEHGTQTQLVTGLAVLGVLSTAYVTHASGLVAAREAGVLKRWRATPLVRWKWFAGRIGATVALATASGAATVAAAALFYGAHAGAGMLVAIVAGAITWASLGTAVSGLIPSSDAAWPLLAATYLPLLLLSGAFGDAAGSPGVMRWLPAEPLIDAASNPLSVHDLAVLAAWAIAGVLASQRLFRWQPRQR
jgi:ABC-2 type transport system permease protein